MTNRRSVSWCSRASFDARGKLVFKAGPIPSGGTWWDPKRIKKPVCDLDVRAGGAIRIQHTRPRRHRYSMTGVYNEVVGARAAVVSPAPRWADGNHHVEGDTVTREKVARRNKSWRERCH